MSDSQSIKRAAAVLRAIAVQPGISLGEISKVTGLARSTVQRLVSSLNSEGFVIKNHGQRGAQLGMELARLGAMVNIDARSLLMPLMEELHGQVGENVDLTILRGTKVIVIEQIASNEAIRIISYVGQEHPIHATANAKAHLSSLSRDEVMSMLSDDLEKLTDNTIIDANSLCDQLDAAKAKNGLYVDEEGYAGGVCAIAISLPDISGQNLALSIAMPTDRFGRKRKLIESNLLELKIKIQETFGSSL